ncbi:hypothetical protein GCM10027590_45600 [Nocardiopsis nanhaiensis]
MGFPVPGTWELLRSARGTWESSVADVPEPGEGGITGVAMVATVQWTKCG